MDFERKIAEEGLQILANLPLLLNSSLEIKRIINVALDQVKKALRAEAVTVFLLDDSNEHLSFWALRGGNIDHLEGKKMPAKRGIVGWAMEKREPILVDDAQKDPRFFKDIDTEGSFTTRNMICVPLIVRGSTVLGAIQILNKVDGGVFSKEELHFVEQFSHQVALAIDNAKLHQAVVQRNHQLEMLDRRKNEVIALIAHEFRTPLNVVMNSAQMLGDGSMRDPALAAKTAETLSNGVQRLIRLISQIRDMLYVSASEFPLSRTTIPVGAFLKKIGSDFEKVATKRGISLLVEGGDRDAAIEGDEVLLHVVLRNLVANAIRFTPDGGKVRVTATSQAGLVVIAVTDTGIGIPSEELALIFQKFYEVTPVMSHSSGEFEFRSCGLGLGLSAAQSIVKAHGSALEVESMIGMGSCFKFSLPQKGI